MSQRHASTSRISTRSTGSGLSAVDSPAKNKPNSACDALTAVAVVPSNETPTPMKASEISREQLLKEAPRLIDYAILRGWMSKPAKPKRSVDGGWQAAGVGHLDDASEDEIQELRKQLGGG